MPTTVVKTIGTGGDYSTLQAWEDAAPANLVTADQVWEGQCKNQTFTLTSALTISGSTTDATRYKKLTCEPGASFSDSVQTNTLRYNASNGSAITGNIGYSFVIDVGEANAVIEGLQIRQTSSTGSAPLRISGGNVTVSRCIALHTAGGKALSCEASTSKLRNSVFYTTAAGIGNVATFFISTDVSGCFFGAASDVTAASNAFTIAYSTGSTFENCLFFGVSNVSSSGSITYTNCATNDSTPPSGCTNLAYDTSTGSGFEGTTASGFDLRLKATSALLNAGVTTSKTPTDIAGTARPQGASFDIGPWEFVAAGGGVTGTVAATESGSDVAAGAGTVLVSGSASVQEAGTDTAAISGGVQITASIAATESGADIAAISGSQSATGTVAVVEAGPDVAAASGAVLVTGAASAQESGVDVAALTGTVGVTGSAAVQESGADVAVISGSQSVSGSVNATESGPDVAALTGGVLVTGQVAAQEFGSDIAQILGAQTINGAAAIVELGLDSASAAGQIFVRGVVAAVESGSDTTAAFAGQPLSAYPSKYRTVVSAGNARTVVAAQPTRSVIRW